MPLKAEAFTTPPLPVRTAPPDHTMIQRWRCWRCHRHAEVRRSFTLTWLDGRPYRVWKKGLDEPRCLRCGEEMEFIVEHDESFSVSKDHCREVCQVASSGTRCQCKACHGLLHGRRS